VDGVVAGAAGADGLTGAGAACGLAASGVVCVTGDVGDSCENAGVAIKSAAARARVFDPENIVGGAIMMASFWAWQVKR
jgi:hypothetical protein